MSAGYPASGGFDFFPCPDFSARQEMRTCGEMNALAKRKGRERVLRMSKPRFRVNLKRMKNEFDAFSCIGRFGKNGVKRVAFSPEYVRARDLLRRKMEVAGLHAWVDAIGNLYGRREGQLRRRPLPVVMAGSHLDSQAPGGRFDGIAGVLAALEAVRLIVEGGYSHDHPLQVVAFVGEESSCGLGHLGSMAAAGLVKADALRRVTYPPDGCTVWEAAKRAGAAPERLVSARLRPEGLKAFLELHIEQGPVLERRRFPIGVVTAITGVFRGTISFRGETAHAGGMPMRYRRDALAAAAEVVMGLERMARAEAHRGAVATVGDLRTHPGAVTIIPGEVEMTVDIRSPDDAAKGRVLRGLQRLLAQVQKRRGVSAALRLVRQQLACPMAPGLVNLIAQVCRERGIRYLRMPSGGGHDTEEMSTLAPAGMIFVPSVRGISHDPAEFTSLSDLARGAEMLASVLYRLAQAGTWIA